MITYKNNIIVRIIALIVIQAFCITQVGIAMPISDIRQHPQNLRQVELSEGKPAEAAGLARALGAPEATQAASAPANADGSIAAEQQIWFRDAEGTSFPLSIATYLIRYPGQLKYLKENLSAYIQDDEAGLQIVDIGAGFGSEPATIAAFLFWLQENGFAKPFSFCITAVEENEIIFNEMQKKFLGQDAFIYETFETQTNSREAVDLVNRYLPKIRQQKSIVPHHGGILGAIRAMEQKKAKIIFLNNILYHLDAPDIKIIAGAMEGLPEGAVVFTTNQDLSALGSAVPGKICYIVDKQRNFLEWHSPYFKITKLVDGALAMVRNNQPKGMFTVPEFFMVVPGKSGQVYPLIRASQAVAPAGAAGITEKPAAIVKPDPFGKFKKAAWIGIMLAVTLFNAMLFPARVDAETLLQPVPVIEEIKITIKPEFPVQSTNKPRRSGRSRMDWFKATTLSVGTSYLLTDIDRKLANKGLPADNTFRLIVNSLKPLPSMYYHEYGHARAARDLAPNYFEEPRFNSLYGYNDWRSIAIMMGTGMLTGKMSHGKVIMPVAIPFKGSLDTLYISNSKYPTLGDFWEASENRETTREVSLAGQMSNLVLGALTKNTTGTHSSGTAMENLAPYSLFSPWLFRSDGNVVFEDMPKWAQMGLSGFFMYGSVTAQKWSSGSNFTGSAALSVLEDSYAQPPLNISITPGGPDNKDTVLWATWQGKTDFLSNIFKNSTTKTLEIKPESSSSATAAGLARALGAPIAEPAPGVGLQTANATGAPFDLIGAKENKARHERLAAERQRQKERMLSRRTFLRKAGKAGLGLAALVAGGEAAKSVVDDNALQQAVPSAAFQPVTPAAVPKQQVIDLDRMLASHKFNDELSHDRLKKLLGDINLPATPKALLQRLAELKGYNKLTDEQVHEIVNLCDYWEVPVTHVIAVILMETGFQQKDEVNGMYLGAGQFESLTAESLLRQLDASGVPYKAFNENDFEQTLMLIAFSAYLNRWPKQGIDWSKDLPRMRVRAAYISAGLPSEPLSRQDMLRIAIEKKDSDAAIDMQGVAEMGLFLEDVLQGASGKPLTLFGFTASANAAAENTTAPTNGYEMVGNDNQVSRGLAELKKLYPGLDTKLKELQPDSKILFIGPGYGFEILDVLISYPNINPDNITAVNREDFLTRREALLDAIQQRYGIGIEEAAGCIDYLAAEGRIKIGDLNFQRLAEICPQSKFDLVIIGTNVMMYIRDKIELAGDIYSILNIGGTGLINLQGVVLLANEEEYKRGRFFSAWVGENAANFIKTQVKLNPNNDGLSAQLTAEKPIGGFYEAVLKIEKRSERIPDFLAHVRQMEAEHMLNRWLTIYLYESSAASAGVAVAEPVTKINGEESLLRAIKEAGINPGNNKVTGVLNYPGCEWDIDRALYFVRNIFPGISTIVLTDPVFRQEPEETADKIRTKINESGFSIEKWEDDLSKGEKVMATIFDAETGRELIVYLYPEDYLEFTPPEIKGGGAAVSLVKGIIDVHGIPDITNPNLGLDSRIYRRLGEDTKSNGFIFASQMVPPDATSLKLLGFDSASDEPNGAEKIRFIPEDSWNIYTTIATANAAAGMPAVINVVQHESKKVGANDASVLRGDLSVCLAVAAFKDGERFMAHFLDTGHVARYSSEAADFQQAKQKYIENLMKEISDSGWRAVIVSSDSVVTLPEWVITCDDLKKYIIAKGIAVEQDITVNDSKAEKIVEIDKDGIVEVKLKDYPSVSEKYYLGSISAPAAGSAQKAAYQSALVVTDSPKIRDEIEAMQKEGIPIGCAMVQSGSLAEIDAIRAVMGNYDRIIMHISKEKEDLRQFVLMNLQDAGKRIEDITDNVNMVYEDYKTKLREVVTQL